MGEAVRDRARLTDESSASVHEVRAALELDLVLGRLRPRERLVEDELMTRFSTKRHVVRTVLSYLESIGLVERRPNKGALVREYALDEVEELYEMRADLHALAVEKMTLPVTAEIAARLRDLADAHEAAIEAGDLAQVILRNNALHDRFFDLCGNRFLTDQIHKLGWAANAIRSYRISDPELLHQAVREHRAMIAAAEAGRRDDLRRLVVEHIQPSKDLYLRDNGALQVKGLL